MIKSLLIAAQMYFRLKITRIAILDFCREPTDISVESTWSQYQALPRVSAFFKANSGVPPFTAEKFKDVVKAVVIYREN